MLARSTWETGQDQCASIKRQLAAMLPGVSIFLDVSPRGLYMLLFSYESALYVTDSSFARACSALGMWVTAVCLFALFFLNQQVDDLRSLDDLEEEIFATGVVMVFVSKGYFQSKSKRAHSI